MLSGNIEAHESVLSVTQVQAPIVYLPFDEGAKVETGTVLTRLDDHLYHEQVEIDRTDLAVAAAQIAANESNLIASQNNVSTGRFDLEEKVKDYGRAAALVKTAAGTEQARD